MKLTIKEEDNHMIEEYSGNTISTVVRQYYNNSYNVQVQQVDQSG